MPSVLAFSTPRTSLIIPIAAAGSGKTTLLNQVATDLGDPGFRFGNDDVRRLVCPGPFVLSASPSVALAARAMVAARLAHGLPGALDCTHNQFTDRVLALDLARESGVTAVALLSAVPADVIAARNVARAASLHVPADVVSSMAANVLELTPAALLAEGFDAVHVFDAATTELQITFT